MRATLETRVMETLLLTLEGMRMGPGDHLKMETIEIWATGDLREERGRPAT